MIKFDPPAYPEWLAKPQPDQQGNLMPMLDHANGCFVSVVGGGTATLRQSRPECIDTRMLFSDERGENEVLQFDGPPMAYYELTTNGVTQRYVYQSVRWQSDSMPKLVMRAKAWADSIRGAGEHIVWRRRPEVWFDAARGKYKFDCRLHVMPYRDIPEAVQQGHETPEA